jgi:hypothetical protein
VPHDLPEERSIKFSLSPAAMAELLTTVSCSQGTDWVKATCGTLRLKLLKVAVLVRISVWRIYLAFSNHQIERDQM